MPRDRPSAAVPGCSDEHHGYLRAEQQCKKAKKLINTSKPPTEHVLWLIRGLRYITGGLDFCAQSEHAFGSSEEEKNRQYWLTFHH